MGRVSLCYSRVVGGGDVGRGAALLLRAVMMPAQEEERRTKGAAGVDPGGDLRRTGSGRPGMSPNDALYSVPVDSLLCSSPSSFLKDGAARQMGWSLLARVAVVGGGGALSGGSSSYPATGQQSASAAKWSGGGSATTSTLVTALTAALETGGLRNSAVVIKRCPRPKVLGGVLTVPPRPAICPQQCLQAAAQRGTRMQSAMGRGETVSCNNLVGSFLLLASQSSVAFEAGFLVSETVAALAKQRREFLLTCGAVEVAGGKAGVPLAAKVAGVCYGGAYGEGSSEKGSHSGKIVPSGEERRLREAGESGGHGEEGRGDPTRSTLCTVGTGRAGPPGSGVSGAVPGAPSAVSAGAPGAPACEGGAGGSFVLHRRDCLQSPARNATDPPPHSADVPAHQLPSEAKLRARINQSQAWLRRRAVRRRELGPAATAPDETTTSAEDPGKNILNLQTSPQFVTTTTTPPILVSAKNRARDGTPGGLLAAYKQICSHSRGGQAGGRGDVLDGLLFPADVCAFYAGEAEIFIKAGAAPSRAMQPVLDSLCLSVKHRLAQPLFCVKNPSVIFVLLFAHSLLLTAPKDQFFTRTR